MTLLAIDASTRNTGIAIYNGVQVVYECSWFSEQFHSVELAPAVELGLRRAGVGPKDLKALAVAIGPGSYTGLRIGLALAKGLVFARNLALVSVPTLDVLAQGQPLQELPMAAALQAGRGRLGVGWYHAKAGAWHASAAAELMTAAELAERIQRPTYVCGELSEEDRATLGRKYKNAVLASPAWSLRRPAILAELGWQRWQAGELTDPAGLTPLYLQASNAVPQ
ncbi:MAG: tRNA (adenosine(37)-N6)-threonylcarbamoyltransferase complex dimerization subunit type 1 TsaB [Anaerolineales bacterium]|nr:MAG: tRNA (adenosine(37)-N6)-threonylcarbamoyltransferase complex dimerization subunit type 1 TsaB [Anaerolineales bacterium]